jgi:hypothetical protein
MKEAISVSGRPNRNLKDMLHWREELMYSYPIIDERITACDLWLAAQPVALSLRTSLEVMWRTTYASALKYEDERDPVMKHCMLLSIRESYRMMQRELPAPYCAAICARLFDEWLDVLNTEEERAGKRMN